MHALRDGTSLFTAEGAARLLILHVASSKLATLNRVEASIDYVGRIADWAVVLYDGSNASSWARVAHMAQRRKAALVVRAGERPSRGTRKLKGRKFYPKLLFWLQAVDLIEQHEYVWLVDEDISFRGFDLHRYWRRLHTAFAPLGRGPPVISQPVINAAAAADFGNPAGKWVEMLNAAAFWQGSEIAAAESSYVEQQAALVDARFFVQARAKWQSLANAQHQAGSDFGLDTIWCGAASVQAPQRVACAVITLGIDHDDTRALNWTSDKSFLKRSRKLERDVYTEVAPDWWAQTQRLRQDLALREHELFEASNRTCFEPKYHIRGLHSFTGHADGSRVQPWNGQPVVKGRNGIQVQRATRLPCALTRLERFPRHYAHVGDVMMIDARISQDVSSMLLTANQTASLALVPAIARRPPTGCCRRGQWKCCY